MKRAKLNALLTILILAAPFAASAQSSLDPGRLPTSTAFYLAWHGTPSGEIRRSNSLLAMWDDPDFAPVRAAIVAEMMQSSADSAKAKTNVTADTLSQYAALLDNELVFGYLKNPNPAKTNGAANRTPHDAKQIPWNGMFLAYDHTGKEATLAKLLLQVRANEKEPPKISTATIAGMSAIKIEGKNGTTYWADDGKYTFSASEPAVLEQISAWAKHATPEAARLSQTSAFREASDLLKGGVAEFFFNFASVRDMDSDKSFGGFRLRPLVQSLKLETVHSIAGHLAQEGARTRMQSAILGDTGPGSLFDIWDEGSTSPSSWQFITANTVSYQEWRVNLTGIYGLIKRAMQSTAGAGQPNPMDFVEAGISTRLGMPLPTAIGLFSGEFASLQSSVELDSARQVSMVAIREKVATLKLLHAGLAERVAAERAEGDTTFLKISEGGMASTAGTASWKYYHLGVTPDVIVGSARAESVRETLAASKGTVSENRLVPAAWQQARTQFPKTINGLGFFDFQKIDWAAAKERWIADSRKKPTSGETQQASADAFANALKDLDPRVFPHHLHLAANASWKDARGVHFDGWIE
jgi:hypothetical protein